MRVKDLEKLKDVIDKWDGEIVVDSYEGNKEDIAKLFTDLLKKNIDKVVVEQKSAIKSSTIKRNIKKLRHNP